MISLSSRQSPSLNTCILVYNCTLSACRSSSFPDKPSLSGFEFVGVANSGPVIASALCVGQTASDRLCTHCAIYKKLTGAKENKITVVRVYSIRRMRGLKWQLASLDLQDFQLPSVLCHSSRYMRLSALLNHSSL